MAHSHHLCEHNLLLLPSKVKQNHAGKAKPRATQSIDLRGYIMAEEKEQGYSGKPLAIGAVLGDSLRIIEWWLWDIYRYYLV